jgi:uncharacterized protein (DUF433 family)
MDVRSFPRKGRGLSPIVAGVWKNGVVGKFHKILIFRWFCGFGEVGYIGDMSAKDSQTLVQQSDKVMCGVPVFSGTEVPVQTMFDYLADGEGLGAFLKDFPSVSRDHALRLLEAAKDSLLFCAVCG